MMAYLWQLTIKSTAYFFIYNIIEERQEGIMYNNNFNTPFGYNQFMTPYKFEW